MTVKRLIELALVLVGYLPEGEEAQPEAMIDGLSFLNAMLGNWSTRRLVVPYLKRETFVMPQKSACSIGPSGDLDTDIVPSGVDSVVVTDPSGTTYPALRVSEDAITSREISDGVIPRFYSIRMGETLPAALFSSTPPAGCAVSIRMQIPFSRISELTADMAEDLQIPSMYEDPILNNLVVRISPKYGRPVSPDLREAARSSLEDLIQFNAANIGIPESQVYSSLSRRPGVFNIKSGY